MNTSATPGLIVDAQPSGPIGAATPTEYRPTGAPAPHRRTRGAAGRHLAAAKAAIQALQ